MHIYKAKIIAIPTIFLQQIICTLYLKWDVMTAKESDEKQTLIRLWSQFAQIKLLRSRSVTWARCV
jgi:predicted ABC-type exoprotein transport system permease subunit